MITTRPHSETIIAGSSATRICVGALCRGGQLFLGRWPLEMRKDLPEAPEMEGLYHISIPSRKPDGEPVYQVIPKFLTGN